jgi:hypothetical protein
MQVLHVLVRLKRSVMCGSGYRWRRQHGWWISLSSAPCGGSLDFALACLKPIQQTTRQ